MKLELNNLKKKYNTKLSVNNINLILEPGIYGLLGGNGAGKSSLMKMICGVLTPTSGEILLDGKNINSLGENYRELLGYLPQDFGYYPDFSAQDFLEYTASLKGLSSKYSKKQIKKYLDIVGLSDVKNKKIRTFSGGMKQRLGIAQAMLNEPKILILDEPTAGLDPKERIKFRNLISSFSKDRIVILSTHIVSDIDYIAETILMMKNGEIIINESNTTATTVIQNKVWELIIKEEYLETISGNFHIVNLQHLDTGALKLRIVSDFTPSEEAKNVSPTLEDLFLYYFDNPRGDN